MHITDIDSKIPKEGEAVHANFHVTLAYAFALPILKISITPSRLYMDNYFDGFAIRKGWKNEETGGLWTLWSFSSPRVGGSYTHCRTACSVAQY